MTQLTLFAAEVRRDSREIMWERAFSTDVDQAVMAIFAAKPAEWLEWKDFKSVINKYKISSCFGHVLYWISRHGKTIEKHIYFGADHPGLPNYLGFKSAYMLAEGTAA